MSRHVLWYPRWRKVSNTYAAIQYLKRQEVTYLGNILFQVAIPHSLRHNRAPRNNRIYQKSTCADWMASHLASAKWPCYTRLIESTKPKKTCV